MFGKGHREAVLSLYRTCLRNALRQDVETVHEVRTLFRKRKHVQSSLVLQKLLLQRNVKVKPVKATEITEVDEKPINIPTPLNFKRKKRNPFFKNFSDEEIEEFTNTKYIDTLPPLEKPTVDSRWYYSSKYQWQIKSKLNKSYMRNILPSLIQYAKQQYKLDKLSAKLAKPPTHKLRRINGTVNWLYVINTPWNRNLRFTDLSFIQKIRNRYDDLIIQQQLTTAYKDKYSDPDFANYEQHLHDQLQELQQESIDFCKRQGIIFNKIKPEFDKMHKHSQHNLKQLQHEIKVRGIGPYTDIVEPNLTLMCRKYGFR